MVSAYIGQKNGDIVTQESNAEALDSTSKTGLASPNVTDTTVAQNSFGVNRYDMQNFGKILLGEDEITVSTTYVHTPDDCAAWLAVPKVLKRGKIIYEHDNHKARGHSPVTIAAPVVINDVPGIMAVVVKETGKNHYKSHRVRMPDGSAFIYQEKRMQNLHLPV